MAREDLIFGHYMVLREINRGAVAIVYKAIDVVLKRPVALKRMLISSKFTEQHQREYIGRFIKEAKAVADLNHPNIVTVHEAGEFEGDIFLAMEYLDGNDLAHFFYSGHRFSLKSTLIIVLQILCALSHAHSRGILHGNIEPNNVYLLSGDLIKVTNFSISKAPTLISQVSPGTSSGAVGYMSPEQCDETLDIAPSSDLFSVGVILYEMLTGQRPYPGTSLISYMGNVVSQDFTPVSARSINPEIPDYLDRIVMRSISRKKEDRYQTTEDMIAALRIILGKLKDSLKSQAIRQKPSMPPFPSGEMTVKKAPFPEISKDSISKEKVVEIEDSIQKSSRELPSASEIPSPPDPVQSAVDSHKAESQQSVEERPEKVFDREEMSTEDGPKGEKDPESDLIDSTPEENGPEKPEKKRAIKKKVKKSRMRRTAGDHSLSSDPAEESVAESSADSGEEESDISDSAPTPDIVPVEEEKSPSKPEKKNTVPTAERFASFRKSLDDNPEKKKKIAVLFIGIAFLVLIGGLGSVMVLMKVFHLGGKENLVSSPTPSPTLAVIHLTPKITPTGVTTATATPSPDATDVSPHPAGTATITAVETSTPEATPSPVSPDQGQILITSALKDGVVRVFSGDGKPYTKGKLTREASGGAFLDLEPGAYTVKLLRDNYYPIVRTGIKVEPGGVVIIDDVFVQKSSILVKTNKEARIFLDGKEAGRTSAVNPQLHIPGLTEGKTYNIVAKRSGYEDARTSITLKKIGHREEVTLTMKALPPPPPVRTGGSYYDSGSYGGYRSNYRSGGSSGGSRYIPDPARGD